MSFFVKLSESGEYDLTSAGYTAVIVLMLLFVCVASFFSSREKDTRLGTRKLVFSAMAMALAYVTSFIKIIHMPMGGSVTLLSMLFITLIGYWYGLRTGLMVAFAYGLLQFVTGPYIVSIPQVLCDYILAFGALGLSGLFYEKKHGLVLGYVAGVIGRFFFSFLSGFIFFADYAPPEMNPALYSFVYNGAYLFAEAAITVAVLLVPAVEKGLTSVKNMAYHRLERA